MRRCTPVACSSHHAAKAIFCFPRWSACCKSRGENIAYWGDIDTHGFAILDSLRKYFPLAASFLMDRSTLMTHALQWGEEPLDKRHTLPLSRLVDDEAALYDDLRDDRIRPQLRLEQERIGYRWLCAALVTTVQDDSRP